VTRAERLGLIRQRAHVAKREHLWDAHGRCELCGVQSDWLLADRPCLGEGAHLRPRTGLQTYSVATTSDAGGVATK
jgi:hypothetical protein